MINKIRSTRWKDPSTTIRQIKMADSGTLIHEGMPINPSAAEIPAYSAQIVPKFAKTKPSTAKYPHSLPQRSRITATKPFPVAAPIRTAIKFLMEVQAKLSRTNFNKIGDIGRNYFVIVL